MPSHNLKSLNVMLMGYVESQEHDLALEFYRRMEQHQLNSRSFIAASMACSALAMREKGVVKLTSLETGRRIHSRAREAGCDRDEFLATTLVDMYSKCGSLEDARAVFDRIESPDVAAWTALIAGHAQNGEGERALEFFQVMKARGCAGNTKTFVAALVACSGVASRIDIEENLEVLEKGMRIHSEAVERNLELNIFVASSLVDMYSKCGSMVDARVFDRVEHHDVVIFTSLLLGYSANGESKLTLELFNRMITGLEPGARTYSAALVACGNLGELQTGKKIHGDVCRAGLENRSPVLVNGLVDFYGKCGSICSAQRVFDSAPGVNLRSNILWNALLSSYSSSGDVQMVLKVFQWMHDEGVEPDGYTFSAILGACSHAGLIDQGWNFFREIVESGPAPSSHHFGCLVDLFGRAGHLSEALAVVKAIPSEEVDIVTKIGVLSSLEVHLKY